MRLFLEATLGTNFDRFLMIVDDFWSIFDQKSDDFWMIFGRLFARCHHTRSITMTLTKIAGIAKRCQKNSD